MTIPSLFPEYSLEHTPGHTELVQSLTGQGITDPVAYFFMQAEREKSRMPEPDNEVPGAGKPVKK